MVFALVLVLCVRGWAGEGVSVTFSVQAIQIQGSIAAKLSNNAQWTFFAEEITSGKTIVEAGNAKDIALSPASLLKLFITGAALAKNEKEAFDLATVIATEGRLKRGKLAGNVIIRGAGNALLSKNDLLSAVEKLKTEKITEINGDIVVDDSFFAIKDWKSRYQGAAYGNPSALGLDMHTVSITTEPASQKVIVEPPNENVKVSFNPAGSPGIRRIDDLTYEITGWKPDAPILRKRFALADPGLYAGGTFLTLMRRAGVRVAGGVKRGAVPSEAEASNFATEVTEKKEKGGLQGSKRNRQFMVTKEISRIDGPDIKTYIRDLNQQSLNVAADNLLFLLGARTYGAPGTREKGIQAVKDILHELGVPLPGLVIGDGSGVSEHNRVSAGQMVAFLKAVSKKHWFPEFYGSLSKPGMDGRLRDFGYKSERIRAKAGQLPEAFGLAGYVDRADGRKIAFAFMVNGSGPDISQAAPAAAAEILKLLEN